MNIKVIPNPISTNGLVFINLPENVHSLKLLVCNTLGENVAVVEKQNLSQGAQWIDISEWSYLPQGLYAMSVLIDEKWQNTIKILKD